MDIRSIISKADSCKKAGLKSIETKIKIFTELKVVSFSDIRLLVDLAYLEDAV